MEDYREDLPELIRGRLDPGRAGEILRAAEHDAELREAIEQERTLERWLEYYEVPEIDAGFERRFWNRFHEEKTGRSASWLFKMIGPMAAAVLIAIGLVIVFTPDDQPVDNTPKTAEDPAPEDDGGVIELEFSEAEYVVGMEPDEPRKLDLETLELLKALDDPAFLALDNLERPDDMAVIDDLELLTKLAEDE